MVNERKHDRMDHKLTNALFKLAYAIHNNEKEGAIQEMIYECNIMNSTIDEYAPNFFKKRD